MNIDKPLSLSFAFTAFWHLFNSTWRTAAIIRILNVCFSLVSPPGATTEPSALWSLVQMCSLTHVQEPTNIWRSSMSVCPTVSTDLLSFVFSKPVSQYGVLSSSVSSVSFMSRHHPSGSVSLSCPHFPVLWSSSTVFLRLFFTLSHHELHELRPVVPFDPPLYSLYYWCARSSFQWINRPGWEAAEYRAERQNSTSTGLRTHNLNTYRHTSSMAVTKLAPG